MRIKAFFLLIFNCMTLFLFAQNVGIGTNNPKAKFEISSSNSGILIPRLTTTARNAIASPLKGLLLYDSTAKQFYYHDGKAWQNILPSSANHWQQSNAAGNEIKNTNAGGFWSEAVTGLNNNSDKTTNHTTAPVSGPGTRLMWIPSRSAFRTGTIEGNYWDASQLAFISFDTGINTTAPGNNSTAIDNYTKALSITSTAMVYYSKASGIISTAIGVSTLASGEYSTAMGNAIHAAGKASTATGVYTVASTDYTTAMAYYTNADGFASTTISDNAVASWDFSTVIGYYVKAMGLNSIAIIQQHLG